MSGPGNRFCSIILHSRHLGFKGSAVFSQSGLKFVCFSTSARSDWWWFFTLASPPSPWLDPPGHLGRRGRPRRAGPLWCTIDQVQNNLDIFFENRPKSQMVHTWHQTERQACQVGGGRRGSGRGTDWGRKWLHCGNKYKKKHFKPKNWKWNTNRNRLQKQMQKKHKQKVNTQGNQTDR